jgi:hypothetical protein
VANEPDQVIIVAMLRRQNIPFDLAHAKVCDDGVERWVINVRRNGRRHVYCEFIFNADGSFHDIDYGY